MKKQISVNSRINELSALIDEQRQELLELRSRLGTRDGVSYPALADDTTRRDLLKVAGGALLGAASVAALRGVPAAAATGANFILGQANDAGATSTLAPTTSTSPNPLMYLNNGLSGTADALKAETGAGPGSAVHGISHGFIGVRGETFASNPAYAGIEGFGQNGSSGVIGSTINGGPGVRGSSSGGLDMWASSSGRVGLNPNTPGGSGAPNYTAANGTLEHIVEDDGSIWTSRASSGNPIGTLKASWKRINSVRVDSATGDGTAFVPVRIIDTRDGTGGVSGPLAANSTTTWAAFTGTQGIPSDAVGIVGNITAIGFPGQGFATIYPAGVAAPGVSSLNFGGTQNAFSNAITVGFGTGANAGKISIFISNNVATHIVVDVFAYIQ